ncbi:hypothetical protein MHTCC0001_29310 [Flavobacteriaceae bacterium MHTCC 0001]
MKTDKNALMYFIIPCGVILLEVIMNTKMFKSVMLSKKPNKGFINPSILLKKKTLKLLLSLIK